MGIARTQGSFRALLLSPCVALCFHQNTLPSLRLSRHIHSSLHRGHDPSSARQAAAARQTPLSLTHMSTGATSSETRIAYLHGFASSAKSAKGVALQNAVGSGICDLPDLNRPSFSKLTVSGALEAMDELHESKGRPRWKLVGSSMGCHIAALWTSMNPQSVESLVLLCPAFSLAELWPSILGRENFEKWGDRGYFPFQDAVGEWQDVHYGLVEDGMRHPAYPHIPDGVKVLVMHGKNDEVVPVSSSLNLPKMYPSHPCLTVELLDDDHALTASTHHIVNRVADFFEVQV